MADYQDELATDEWRRVLVEARDLGVLQCHLSGGEPLLRRDLVDIVAGAHDLGLYTNLVTSALGLSRAKAEQLRAAGLDRSEEHTSELQSRQYLVCRLLLEKKKNQL